MSQSSKSPEYPQSDLKETFATKNRRSWEGLILSSAGIYFLYCLAKVIAQSPEFTQLATEINKNIAIASLALQNIK